MKRSFLLTALSLMLSTKALSQSEAGAEQYCYFNDRSGFTFVPLVYMKTDKNWYFEGRYNYEAANTLSVYAGKIFERESAFSYSVNPVAGLVAGNLKGGSLGINIDLSYKKYSFSTQSQYTFCAADKTENFFYSWSETAFEVNDYLSTGIALQDTKSFARESKFDKGIFLKMKFKRWTLPLYIFSRSNSAAYVIISLNYQWMFKKTYENRSN